MTSEKILSIPKAHYFYLEDNFLNNFKDKQPNWGPLGYVSYKRTYARPIVNRQEEYWETCQRFVETIFTVQKHHILTSKRRWDENRAQKSAQKMYTYAWELKFTPPGRGLWALHLPLLEAKGGGAVNNCAFKSTKDIDLDFAEPFTFLMDFSMLGVGVGFDTLGAGKVVIQQPRINNNEDFIMSFLVQDDRESWVDYLRHILLAYVGKTEFPGEYKEREYKIRVPKYEGGYEYKTIKRKGLDINFSLIREETARIETFGGTASGPEPLIELFSNIIEILNKSIGQEITSTVIVDLMNAIGKCVVSGNVRRSSEIALGDREDKEFYKLKDPTECEKIKTKLKRIGNKIPAWKSFQEQKEQIEAELYSGKLDSLSEESKNKVAFLEKIKQLQDLLVKENNEYQQLMEELKAQPLINWRWASNNTIKAQLGMKYERLGNQIATNGEPAPFWLEIAQKYGRLIDPENNKDYRALGTNPCSEQTLEDNELCCLVETYPTKCKNLTEWLDVLKYAYLYAKTVTLIPTHYAPTNEVMARNRRIGTSMAGIIEMYCNLGANECKKWWDTGYKTICNLDKIYSEWLAVPESNKKTSVKPGGTVPLLVGVEGGMKTAISPYYFRTIRIDKNSSLVKLHEDAGYLVEDDLTTPRTKVIYFPIFDQRSTRFAKDFSIWEQVEICSLLQTYWSDNQVSATVTFKKEEAKDISKILELFEGRLKSISFLPLNEHGYVQAPYIPCTKEEYEESIKKIKEINWNGEIFKDSIEKFCEGDICQIKR